MLNMGHYDIMEDDVEEFARKQGYKVVFADELTKAIRYTKVLQMWGFTDDEETQRILNRIMIRIMACASKI